MKDLPKSILASVVMTTYNHENYIRKAIEGVLMQKTNFPIELIIGEDCSNDNTRNIVLEYENKYPLIIKLLLSEKNLGMTENYIRTVQATTGKYIAFCEGDDYWTDPLKLQKQVDFMEANEDCSLCYHTIRVKTADGSRKDYFFGPRNISEPTKYNLEDFIKANNKIGIRTSAMMIRSEVVLNAMKWQIQSPVGDLSLQLYCGLKGKYGYLPDEMAVYNRGNPGAWSANYHSAEWRLKQIHDLNKAYTLFNVNTNYKYHEIIKKRNEDWIRTRIEYVQNHFSRSDQFKIIREHYKILIVLNKKNILFWMRFFLGNQTINKFFYLKNKQF